MTRAVDELLEGWLEVDPDSAEADRLRADIEAAGRLAELRSLVETFGALVLTLPPHTPNPAARDRLLAELDSTDRFVPYLEEVAGLLDLDPARARDVLSAVDRVETWHPGPVAGSWVMPVPKGPLRAGAMASLLKVDPGVRFPDHTHHGKESFFILQGACRESDGTESRRGELLSRPDGSHHDFVVMDGPPLVVLAVVEGHIEIHG